MKGFEEKKEIIMFKFHYVQMEQFSIQDIAWNEESLNSTMFRWNLD